ncbi:MAG: sn-glycerol-1-phosphate dehydrogenase, partial [Proteobacteria bacterium]|nr:sn-glycerol-1-phosphate dehydrogenase [Pseudomonadota bacterium]
DEDFWGPLSDVVRKEYRKKIPKCESALEKLSVPKNWDALRSILSRNLLPARKIKNCLKQAGAAHRIGDIRLGDRVLEKERCLQIWKNANQMRERYTVLDLAVMLGIMPEGAEEIAAEWVVD